MTLAARLDNAASLAGFAAVAIDMAGVGCNAALVIDAGLLGGHAAVAVDLDVRGANSATSLAFAGTGAAGDHGAMLVGAEGASTRAVDDLPVMGAGRAADCGAIATGIDVNRVSFHPQVEASCDLRIGALLQRIDAFALGRAVSRHAGAAR